jgi:hypothetical protein
MSDQKPVVAPTPGRDRVLDARLEVGSVHWQGARIVSHVTTDKTITTVSGNHVLLVDEMFLHPAGLLLRLEGQSWIIPHARVETYRLA